MSCEGQKCGVGQSCWDLLRLAVNLGWRSQTLRRINDMIELLKTFPIETYEIGKITITLFTTEEADCVRMKIDGMKNFAEINSEEYVSAAPFAGLSTTETGLNLLVIAKFVTQENGYLTAKYYAPSDVLTDGKFIYIDKPMAKGIATEIIARIRQCSRRLHVINEVTEIKFPEVEVITTNVLSKDGEIRQRVRITGLENYSAPMPSDLFFLPEDQIPYPHYHYYPILKDVTVSFSRYDSMDIYFDGKYGWEYEPEKVERFTAGLMEAIERERNEMRAKAENKKYKNKWIGKTTEIII
jgi:hypothetical protein